MSARPSSLRVADQAPLAAGVKPEILRAVGGRDADSCASATGGGKSQRHKASLKRKAVLKKRSTMDQKAAKGRAIVARTTVSRKSSKKGLSAPVINLFPQFVPSDKAPTVMNSDESISAPIETLVLPVVPVTPMAEIEPEVPTISLVMAEAVADHGDSEGASMTPEVDALVSESAVSETGSGGVEQKATLLESVASQWDIFFAALTRTWNWVQQKLKSRQVKKRLRICETVSLGDKRFIAVIQVDGEQFLVGGSSNSVSTLAHLEPRREFSDVFKSRCEQDLSQA